MHKFPFKKTFEIGGRSVGGPAPALVIAEAGVAHFGNIDMAFELVELASSSGADVFKTQIFDVDELFVNSQHEWRERLRPRNLTLEDCHKLKTLCDSKGLLFAATAHDSSRISWLQELDVPVVKVGSGERNNLQFITELASLDKPMIVSTGMYGEADVIELLDVLAEVGCDRVALLHCVTSYPTPEEQVNLTAMGRLKELFPGPVGYSDHTVDGLAVIAAVARGASIIEKHITILRDVPNSQDWKVSAGPSDFGGLIENIRRVEASLGHGRKELAPCEKESEGWALKSLVAARNLSAGHCLTAGDITVKRPGCGVPGSRLNEFCGHSLTRNVAADALLTFEDID